MSGIAGYVNLFGDPAGEATLRRMARQLEPRAPAGEVVVRHDHAGLICRPRAAAAPPVRSADGRYLFVSDGEVYNHAELRAALNELGQSVPDEPGQVLLASWRQWGAAGLDRCHGSFSFAVLDTHTGDLVLARDAFGVCPLYLAADESGRVAFASNLRAVLAAAVVPRRPDDITVYRYLRYGAVDDTERTFFDRISRLLPGELATISPDGRVRRESYTRIYGELALLSTARRPYDEPAQHQLAAELSAARRRRGSGAPASLPEPATLPPPTDAPPPTRTELVEFVRVQQEPVGSPAAYAQFQQLAAAPARAAVLLAGEVAADQPAPGIRRLAALAESWPDQRGRWLRWWHSPAGLRLLGPEFAAAHVEDPPPYAPEPAVAAAARDGWLTRQAAPPREWLTTWVHQLMPPSKVVHEDPPAVVFQRRLPASLRYAARNADRFATTVRVPLLDPALLRLLWSFAPIGASPRGPERRAARAWVSRLGPAIEQVITSGSFIDRRYVDQPAVLDAYREFSTGRRHVDALVFWRLLNLELWLAEWIDRDPTWPPARTQVEHYRGVEPPAAALVEVEAGQAAQERPGSSLRRTSPTTSATSEMRSSSASPR